MGGLTNLDVNTRKCWIMLDYLPLLDPGINQNKHHVERIPNLRGFSGTHWCPQKHVQMQLLDRTVNCLHSGHPTSCKNFTGGPSFPFPKVQMVVSASLSPPIPIPNFPPKPPPFVRPVSDEIQVRALSSANAVPLPNVSLCLRHSGDLLVRCEA